MIDTFSTIQTEFNASSALLTIFPDGCYVGLDRRSASLPVCTVKITGARREKNTRKTARVIEHLQFQMWSTDADQLETAVDALVNAFDERALVMEYGGVFSRCWFDTYDIDKEDEDVYQANARFYIEYFMDTL